ncbi:uncharacterized protein LOC130688829 [Daphnia carinata]|uniref:uncharacterized protein LOC130688829 n=1 Tax=Daphnia carinata TaxID=120202 RepID=UPI00257BFAA2|nr:uncharacterized protein LOC130688829 [Daphnia carinata]
MVSYTRLSSNLFRGLSVTNIVLWIICTGLVTAITIRYTNLAAGYTENSVGNLDFVFAGLWSSLFYGIGGLVGLCASYECKKHQMKVVAVLCGLGFCGAIVAAGISGHIAAYITENKDDTNNTICHPEVFYPPVFTEVQLEQDCKVWAILEYMLMAYSIAAVVINAILLISVAIALTGPKKKNNFA